MQIIGISGLKLTAAASGLAALPPLSYEEKAEGEVPRSSPQSGKTSRPFFPHVATLLTAHLQMKWGWGALKIHKSFRVHNGLCTLPAHTSASTEQAGPAPSTSGLKTTTSIWSTSNTQSLPRPELWSLP